MKKNIVIIAATYYPETSPVGNIAKQFIKYLESEFNIIIICSCPFSLKEQKYLLDEQIIYGLSSIGSWIRYRCDKKNDLFHRGILFCVKVLDVVKRLIICNGSSKWFSIKTYKKLKEIYKINTFDTVISFSGDFATHEAMLRYKSVNNNVRWFTYTSDLGSLYPGNHFKKKQFSKLESKIFNKADSNFVTKEIYQATSNEIYNGRLIELPYLLKFNSCFNKKTLNPYPVLTYCGRFYSDIRNPQYLLEVFSNLNDTFSFNLYTQGSCQDIVDCFASKNANIKRFDMVSKNDLLNIYTSSDFLISMGNNVSGFQPSKLYEYISFGKPIIHFYYKEQDYTLCGYPYALQIKIGNEINDSIRLINEFLRINMNAYIDKKIIQNIYINNSEEYIKKLILSEFDKGGYNG